MKRSVAAILGAIGLVAGAVGCGGGSGGSGQGGSGGGAGGPGAGGASGTGNSGGGACTTLANIGGEVAEVAATGTMPTAAGGVVVDGTYVLTGWDVYPPGVVSTTQRKTTFKFTGAQMEVATESTDNPAGILGTATFTTSGTNSTITWLCGAAGAFSQGYTATATELVMLTPTTGVVQTYSKQ